MTGSPQALRIYFDRHQHRLPLKHYDGVASCDIHGTGVDFVIFAEPDHKGDLSKADVESVPLDRH
jgi:hypothetical protein